MDMVLSRENMVLGYLHMNNLKFWWNANDDGEARVRKKQGVLVNNVQDHITTILHLPGGAQRL